MFLERGGALLEVPDAKSSRLFQCSAQGLGVGEPGGGGDFIGALEFPCRVQEQFQCPRCAQESDPRA